MSEEQRPLLEEFTSFAKGLSLSDIPDHVVDRLKLCFLDQIGVSVAGSQLSHGRAVRSYVRSTGKEGPAQLIGAAGQYDAEAAALVNATAGHGLEFDDFCATAPCHPGCVVVPSVLALGDETNASGAEAMVALALGYELVTRVALAAGPSMVRGRGIHETCAQGVFGSAIATARLSDASPHECVMGLSLAASHASGIYEFAESGGEVKRLHAGMGAAFGIRSMRLAQHGMTGPATALEGPKGFLQAFSDKADSVAFAEGLGTSWKLLLILLREFPVAGGTNPAVRALLNIMQRHEITADDIVAVKVGKELKRARDHAEWAPPTDLISAQFSPQFILGLAAVKGDVRFRDLLDLERAKFRDPALERVAQAVTLVSDARALASYPGRKEAEVTVTVRGGRQWVERVGIDADHQPGKEFIMRKFLGNVQGHISDEATQQIIDMVDDLEALPSIRSLSALLAGTERQ